jgi:SAM-dependent methyltransferase
VTDPYLDGVYRWWHLSRPSPELLAAEADGWLSRPGIAVDIGCGRGSELAYLASAGWRTLGIDRSGAAVRLAHADHGGLRWAQADALALPLADASADLAIDRGCFHYLDPGRWPAYAAAVARVLRPGGRLLLRACLTSQGVRNEVTGPGVRAAFAGWHLDLMDEITLVSDTRAMRGLAVRLRRV